MSPSASVVPFNHLLATVFFKNKEKLFKNTRGYYLYIRHTIKQNIILILSCVNHRHYFKHLTKNPSAKMLSLFQVLAYKQRTAHFDQRMNQFGACSGLACSRQTDCGRSTGAPLEADTSCAV